MPLGCSLALSVTNFPGSLGGQDEEGRSVCRVLTSLAKGQDKNILGRQMCAI